jgi:hypothetical protein
LGCPIRRAPERRRGHRGRSCRRAGWSAPPGHRACTVVGWRTMGAQNPSACPRPRARRKRRWGRRSIAHRAPVHARAFEQAAATSWLLCAPPLPSAIEAWCGDEVAPELDAFRSEGAAADVALRETEEWRTLRFFLSSWVSCVESFSFYQVQRSKCLIKAPYFFLLSSEIKVPHKSSIFLFVYSSQNDCSLPFSCRHHFFKTHQRWD